MFQRIGQNDTLELLTSLGYAKQSITCIKVVRNCTFFAPCSVYGVFDIGGSAKKVGRRIKELERLYGIEHGGDRKSKPNNSVLNNSQSDLASQLGISVDTLQNYKMLSDMIPELEELDERSTESIFIT